MKKICDASVSIPAWQQTIRDKCYHPTDTFVPFDKEEIGQSIPERFEKMVKLYPDRLAVKTTTRELTYDELNKAANRAAHAILVCQSEAVEPIAVLLEDGISLVIATLGVLKSGKTYVQLAPSLPQERLRYSLDNSTANIIIAGNKNLASATTLSQGVRKVINIDGIDITSSCENPGLRIPADAHSHIHYTSGSTGQPKGIVQSHRSVLHDVMIFTNAMHVSTEDRITSVSFDLAMWQVFRALLNGAAFIVLDTVEQGLLNLASWIIQEEITIYISVPTAFRHLMNSLPEDENFQNIRLIYLIGESVFKKDVQLYKRYFQHRCIFVNVFGSTEVPYVSHYFVDMDTEITENFVPVGYVVDDTEISLLDDNGSVVGYDQVGEIAVKSSYMAMGYWGNPGLTSSTFQSDNNGGDERICITGDLGLMKSDGCLIHVGRKDFQVKIRGYRIELEEIERALLDLGAFKEVVVVAQQDHQDEPQLVAYLVPSGKLIPSTASLRDALLETLPDYMLPATFMFLDALPLTSGGKLDRRALPAPGRSRKHRS